MQLKWTEPATEDLDKVEAFIARDNSPVVAIDVVLKIINTAKVCYRFILKLDVLAASGAHVNWSLIARPMSWSIV